MTDDPIISHLAHIKAGIVRIRDDRNVYRTALQAIANLDDDVTTGAGAAKRIALRALSATGQTKAVQEPTPKEQS